MAGVGEGKSVLGCMGRNGGVSFLAQAARGTEMPVTQTGSSEGGAAQEMQSSELGRMSLRCCQCDTSTERGQDSGRHVSFAEGLEDHQYGRHNYCFLHHNCIIGIVADSRVLSTCLALF